MTAPRTLLAEYATRGSEEAFRELVTRHIDLVYSTAVRLVNGDRHRAEDVAQTVFADLARLAKSLSTDVMVGGWLHRRTCHVALSLMRSERRRQHREREAADMNAQQGQTEASFDQITPMLDEAIDQLGAEDRTAIVLRFFERRNLRVIGAALGSNDDAAQKRISRALEKLRGLLARRGVTASSAGLAALLAAHAVTAAPVELAGSVASAAWASAAASGGAALTLLKLMTMMKLKVAVGAVMIAGFTTTLVLEHEALTRARDQNQTLRQQVEKSSEQAKALATRRVLKPRLPAPRAAVTAPGVEPAVDKSRGDNLIARLLNGEDSIRLSPPELESFLRDNRRDAGSLLAAFRTTEDPAFLRQAMAEHPSDPRVNFTASLAAMSRPDSTPEERRQLLESFKQSAPENALANYLSAREHFRSREPDQAVTELVAASGKAQLQDYSGEFIQNAEEAYRAAGYSEAEAKAIAMGTLPLPQLARLRDLGKDIGELAKLYRQAGDELSADAAVQMGLSLAQQIGEPLGSHFLLHDMIGVNIESQILESMDASRPYDDAGHTIKERLDELAQRREEIKRLGDPSVWMGGERRDVLVTLWEEMPPQDLISFCDRIKVSGEREALRWALNRLGKE
jgi:RNA polymerase sigma factor (sigma-70 family)